MNADRKLYDALLDFLSSAVTDGHDEYERRMAAWALLEKLKNKYGGQAPATEETNNSHQTKSVTLYFQMCGRGTRIASGKTDCLLLDFLYQATKKKICRPAHLIAKSDDEVEQITKILEGNGMPEDVIVKNL